MKLRKLLMRVHPALLVLSSFLMAAAVGTLLLKLPFATKIGHIDWIDALFTATSAICVTGLIVVDTGSYFTVFGHIVILALIQIGGLGVMTFSVALFQWIGRSLSYRHRMAMQDIYAHTPREDIFKVIKHIFQLTFTVELIGAIVLTLYWWAHFPFPQALYTGIFHSVSAFCNAGFSLFSDSMMEFNGSMILNTTICGLIVIGGLGFPVLYDLQYRFVHRKERKVRLMIQTKTVLWTSVVLIVIGAILFAFLEKEAPGQTRTLRQSIFVPLFQSITCRTAGFNTVDIGSLKEASLCMMIFLMFIGASPGSCGGGVKTTTLAILVAFTIARITKGRRVTMFKKSIPDETVTRSISLILVAITLISLIFFLLLANDSINGARSAAESRTFLAYLFETVSAFGTVGLSMGITPHMDTWGKSLIVLMMFIGRVGVLTFAYIIVGRGRPKGLEYSEENMMVG